MSELITDAAPDGTGPRATILVVDDAPESLTALADVLSPVYRVCVATCGADALAVARTVQPDLVLLDVLLPDTTGYEVLERLHADPLTAAVPVILVTALHATDDEERGFRAGAVDFITKPFRPTIVLARVRTQLELKRTRDLLTRHNGDLTAEVARRMRENETIQDVSIRALALVTEARDLETGNHLQRTREYVRTLALELRRREPWRADDLTDRRVELLAKSAPLHDIGKVGIPDHILLKPGPLTPGERVVMETHAALGGDAIARALAGVPQPIEFLSVAMEIARHHHERWDGAGYPDRLAGGAIPLAARLMAVADVFDALISRRVYKPAMPAPQARSIIVGDRGKHFDPTLVDCFEAVFDEMCAISRRYADTEEELLRQAARRTEPVRA